MGSTTAVSTPQDQIDSLLTQMAEEANIEIAQDLGARDLSKVADVSKLGEEDKQLVDRLRALRPAI